MLKSLLEILSEPSNKKAMSAVHCTVEVKNHGHVSFLLFYCFLYFYTYLYHIKKKDMKCQMFNYVSLIRFNISSLGQSIKTCFLIVRMLVC